MPASTRSETRLARQCTGSVHTNVLHSVHFAGKTQEDAAFHLDQRDAAFGQLQVLFKKGVVARVGIVVGRIVTKIAHL